MRKRLPALLLLTAFVLTFAGVAVYFSAGGTIWTKADDNLSHSGDVFEITGPYDYDFIVNLQLTPEIQVVARKSHLAITGKYYRSWTDGDVRPVFTREELLDRLLLEAEKQLPPDFTVEFHPNFLHTLETFDTAARQTEKHDEETRTRRKLSHMFGSVEE